ncbi:MAG: acyl-CoA dehydrogenase family protein, partial [Alphaproteobacteria bacterium]
MDFTLSDEQKLLKDSVDRFVAEKYGLDVRRALVASEDGFGRENWKTFAELGWLSIPFAEASGGLGGGPIEVMVLMEAFGRGLVVEPFISTILTGASLVEALGDKEQKAAILPSVIQGKKLIAFAHVEPQARFTLSDIMTTATADGSGYRISGHKAVVFGGDSANHLIVSARTSGDQRDENGISLFLVDAEAAGVTRRSY